MDLKSLEALGITTDSLIDRIVDKCAEELMSDVSFDEDGEEWRSRSRLAKKLDERIQGQINSTIGKLAEIHVLPNVSSYIEGLTLNATNQWGEKTGKSLTFIEYLTQRADAYMREEVNYEGKSRAEAGSSYSFNKTGTRVAHLIDKHLHYSIETAMKNALANANSSIATGLNEAVKIALQNATEKLKVAVSTK